MEGKTCGSGGSSPIHDNLRTTHPKITILVLPTMNGPNYDARLKLPDPVGVGLDYFVDCSFPTLLGLGHSPLVMHESSTSSLKMCLSRQYDSCDCWVDLHKTVSTHQVGARHGRLPIQPPKHILYAVRSSCSRELWVICAGITPGPTIQTVTHY